MSSLSTGILGLDIFFVISVPLVSNILTCISIKYLECTYEDANRFFGY